MLKKIIKNINAKIGKILFRYLLHYKPELSMTIDSAIGYRKDVQVGKGTYIGRHSIISNTNIGKYCSIGPNLICGYGIHPTNGISTSPSFYSSDPQNGLIFCTKNKIDERKTINIGNDVFIGVNVTILDGVNIGDGAVIGAGAVVNKDIPPYAVAVGVPAKIAKYRFDEDTIKKLLEIKWWDFDNDKIKDVEKYFLEVDKFLSNEAYN